MSYKDYSVEAVKEIMSKVSESQKKERDSDLNKLSLVDRKSIEEKSGLSSGKSHKKIDYEYNRPTTAESNRINDTHIFIEKWFESDLSEKLMWNVIQTKLDHTFTDKDTSGEVKKGSSKKKWIYNNHCKYEMIFSFKKDDRFANLRVSKRIGFWGPQIDGVVHGSYTTLLLYGLTFALYQPSLQISIGIIALLWVLNAFIIYKFSISSRRKKHKHLTSVIDNLVDHFLYHSESRHLSNTGTKSRN